MNVLIPLALALILINHQKIRDVAITDLEGYSDEPPKVGTQKYVGDAVGYTSEVGGYSLSIPSRWEKRRHESQADYFVAQNEEVILAELRPRCFHKTGIVMAEAIRQ